MVIRLYKSKNTLPIITVQIKTYHTGLLSEAAAEVEGWDSPGRGPGDAGNIVFKVGLTVFFIQAATLELWFFTPSAAVLTVSIKSPKHIFNEVTTAKLSRKWSEIMYMQDENTWENDAKYLPIRDLLTVKPTWSTSRSSSKLVKQNTQRITIWLFYRNDVSVLWHKVISLTTLN